MQQDVLRHANPKGLTQKLWGFPGSRTLLCRDQKHIRVSPMLSRQFSKNYDGGRENQLRRLLDPTNCILSWQLAD